MVLCVGANQENGPDQMVLQEINNGPLTGISGNPGNMVASNWLHISYFISKRKNLAIKIHNCKC